MPAGLDRDLRDLWIWPALRVRARGDVTGNEHAWMPRNAEIRLDGDATAAALRDAERVGEMARPHAGRPHDGSRWNDLPALQRDRRGVHARYRLAQPDVDSAALQGLERVASQGLVERRDQAIEGLDHDHARAPRVYGGKVAREHAVEPLDERTRHLDPGGPAADQDEVQDPGIDQRRLGARCLELPDDVPS